MIRSYDALVLRLKRAGVVPKKHVLDNEVSEAMKNHIRDDLKFTMELVPPGCHRRNAAEVAIRNFNLTFSAFLQERPTISPLAYGIDYCPKQKSLSTYSANPTQLLQYQLTRTTAVHSITTKCH
jgi:hypothetical protein